MTKIAPLQEPTLMVGRFRPDSGMVGRFRPDSGYLFHWPQDRCLARLGPGARLVALIAAAHAVGDRLVVGPCGSLMACAGRAPQGRQEAQEGSAQLEVALPFPTR